MGKYDGCAHISIPAIYNTCLVRSAYQLSISAWYKTARCEMIQAVKKRSHLPLPLYHYLQMTLQKNTKTFRKRITMWSLITMTAIVTESQSRSHSRAFGISYHRCVPSVGEGLNDMLAIRQNTYATVNSPKKRNAKPSRGDMLTV